jgi:hypothetical protein
VDPGFRADADLFSFDCLGDDHGEGFVEGTSESSGPEISEASPTQEP